ncbi:MAG: TIGR00725 family protein [Longimicrobiales bacterium]
MPDAFPEPRIRIAVCGASHANLQLAHVAEELGREIARNDCILVCGGMGGVMEAVARGACLEGGATIGVLPGDDPHEANPWISLPLPTGMGEGRNILVVRFANVIIALGGDWGTLSEIALAMRTGTPVILLQPTLAKDLAIEIADSPHNAVARALVRARARTA